MNIKLENAADYKAAIIQILERLEALESAQPAYKQDPVLKMPESIKNAFLKARKEFLPLNMTGRTKKDNKPFAKFEDYREATNKAFKDNNIFISFMENKEPMKLATIISVNREEYTMETEAKLANMQDHEMAVKFGFLNAKTSVYKSLSQLK